jgi:MFS family permease
LEQVHGSVRTSTLIFNALGHFSTDGMNNFVPIIAEILYTTETKHFSLFYVGILTPVFYVASTILSTFVGRWADRGTSPGRLITIGILFQSTGLFGFYMSFVLLSGPPLIGGVLLWGSGAPCTIRSAGQ